ncbi:1-acyl-sn-glycerol-3-phosphate acyltransferase [Aequitasia blattaphilus]|uniref:1-acyl-sn-glycerol-3-phosphate acyltransferase n=1 Tax=Aequitasia blattaphilus TaxID=2949332 RepID=A0ABT1E4W1_9FIRM|nr:lysophospholipid acyltransferase family protein [Aequitasia blattaphilus]MCP1100873.1 1-acyl-sn-glycerol-3-phosphate acyltransferase [Aequitasia blattaphilus]MCR8613513.1 1-acyl-sn-glycerol-3-phosphate acyltransferase [Aequitasia blattaphilus]
MIRFIIAVIFLIVYLVISVPVLFFTWLIGTFSKKSVDKIALSYVTFGFQTIIRISGAEIVVKGKEKIPKEAALFIGNHRSYFDILITYVYIQRTMGYVAKKEMLRYPLLRNWMKRIHCVFLDRENPKEGLKSILEAISFIKSGISIFIFPEGTRNDGKELSMLPFHAGSFKIAEKSGSPIVPVSLNNTASIFENQFPAFRKSRVILEFGDPIYLSKMDREEKKHIATYTQEIIQKTIEKNAKE